MYIVNIPDKKQRKIVESIHSFYLQYNLNKNDFFKFSPYLVKLVLKSYKNSYSN